MNFIDIFWIFLLVVSLTPLVQQKMLESSRLRMMRKIEIKRNSRVIALIHRQESMSILGFPVMRYIDIHDSEEVLRAIKLTDDEIPIDIILHTPGGLVLASEQIAYALSKRKGKVNIFIPHYAMSGGTLIAIAADEIFMDANAVLGPVDPQVGQFPAVSILNLLKQKDINKVEDETLILADVSKKAVRQVKETIQRIACCHYTIKEAAKLANELASGKWTHDYPISVEEARELGLKVKVGLPEEVYQLMNLYPQAGQRRPTVTYIPVPYGKRADQPKEGKTKQS